MKRLLSVALVVIALVLGIISCTLTPSPMPVPSPTSNPAPTLAPFTPLPTPTPAIQVTLDYFGIKDTHQPSVYVVPNKIQLYVVADDGKTRMEFSYPSSGEGLPMEYFQLEDLGEQTIFHTSSVGDHFSISVLAYSCADKEATLSLGRALQAFEPSMGPLLDFYEKLPQSKELIGWYEHTWYATDEWGIEQGKYEAEGKSDLRLWFRIWSNREPALISKPLFIPEVRIQDVKLPTGVRIRQPSEQYQYKVWDFAFTITNNEPFSLPVYWHLESSYKPETKVFPYDYPTEGTQTVPGSGKVTIKAQYWFTVPGDYQWKYIAEYPKGNPLVSWMGTLKVSP